MNTRVRYHVAWSMASTVAKNGFLVITYMVLARLLDPPAFGLIAIAMVGMGLAYSFIDSGFTSVVVRQPSLDRNVLSSLYWFNCALGFGAAVLLGSAGWGVAAIYHDHRLVRLMGTAAVALFIGSFGQQFMALLQRKMAFRAIAFIEGGCAAIAMAVALVRANGGNGPVSYFEGLVAGNAVAAVCAAVAARRDFFPRFVFSTAALRGVFRFGIFNTAERCINFLSFNLEKPLLGRLFSLELLGLYTVVNQLVTRPLMFFSGAFSRVAYPLYANLQNDHASLNAAYIGYTGKLALIVFPMYGFLALFDGTLIPLLFGAHFSAAQTFMTPLCILGALWSIGNPFGSYLMALNRAKIGFAFNLAAALLTIFVFIVGSGFSLTSMLWMWVVAVLGILLPVEWTIRYRLTGMHPWHYAMSFLPHAVTVAVMCAALLAARTFFGYTPGAVPTILEMAAACALYGSYCLVQYRRHAGTGKARG